LRSARFALVRIRFAADFTFGKTASEGDFDTEKSLLESRKATRQAEQCQPLADGALQLDTERDSFSRMENLLIIFPVLIISIVVHEYAHGWMALRQGDQTAAMLGRLTLNPIPHIDPVGSILVPGLLVFMQTGAILGWAKPVPVNPRNFRNFKRGDILVSLAGVAANLLLVVVFTMILVITIWLMRLIPAFQPTGQLVLQMAGFGVSINFILILFNLIPIPPLDGSHVFYYLLPPHLAVRYRQLGQYGFVILFALLFLGGFRFIFLWSQWLTRMTIGVGTIFT
jgi:Zn-dependent protease